MATKLPPTPPGARRKPLTRVEKLLAADGALCVTFINTGSVKRKSLGSYADLIAWGVDTGALSAGDGSRLAAAAAQHPGRAAGVVRRRRTLGARLRRILLAFAAGGKPAAADLEAFNAELRAALSARELVATHSGCRWTWGEREDDLDRMFWPVLLSAAELLASGAVGRLRECAAPGCDLLFVTDGGRRRKWCGRVCGNRATSARYYHRKIKPQRAKATKEEAAEDKARLAGHGGGPKRPPSASEG